MEKKIPIYAVKFNDTNQTLFCLPDEMRQQDWESMAESIVSIKVVFHTRKWFDDLGEWDG